MKALDLEKFIEEDKNKIEKVPQKSLVWNDIVTGTKYFLKIETYNAIISNLYENIKDLTYDEMIRFLTYDNKICFIPWKESIATKKPSFIDVIKLYVLFACIFDGADKTKRKNIYIDFILGKYSFKKAYKIVRLIAGKNISKEDRSLLEKLDIILVKGGAFKVKKYYLENNKLKDMRGASTLLTYVTEKEIPEIINKAFMNESLIYSGGGNVMCIVPNEKIATKLCLEFEKKFDKYTLTVENAFSYCKCNLYDFIKNYREEMRKLESKIENRKKLKIYNNIVSKSQLNNQKEGIDLNNGTVLIKANELKNKKEICSLCSIRKASYSIDEEIKNVCGSCLHKHIVGSNEKIMFNDKIKKYIRKKYGIEEEKRYNFTTIGSINDIEPKTKKIAVIYGDGNNIGAIIQNINSIFEMMYFSRKIQNAANEAVYEAILKNNDDKKNTFKFEIIAVGGDDIFFIVPASKALGIAKDLIEVFNNQFINETKDENGNKYNATMSIGIAISKSNNDIRKLVEIAQKELKNAKDKERKLLLKNKNSGSLSIAFIKGSNYLSKELVKNQNKKIKQSMLPMSNNTFKDILKLVSRLKSKENKVNISRISRIEEASKKMDISEFMLFYLYNDAKKGKVLSKIFEKINIELYKFDKGTFIEKENEEKQVYFPWSDILNFWKYV
ncbi:hypothetical protein ACFIJ5_09570 [Haloimpatiens sp. FM7330]|uniref:Cas10/Cmr2 second palm domain-containing protein n=1 Tax=Haloimpatiens sp. FM7330 TaxID=3298610 RepID=UPI0036252D65